MTPRSRAIASSIKNASASEKPVSLGSQGLPQPLPQRTWHHHSTPAIGFENEGPNPHSDWVVRPARLLH